MSKGVSMVGALPNKEADNVINLRVIDGKIAKKDKVKYNKDGTISKRKCNSIAGKSKEVYPFVSEEEIKAMIDVFDKRIEEADTENHRQIACRDKMLFLIGVNLGIRVSDLCELKYSFFINKDGSYKDYYSLQPKKTKKTGKFVKLYFNQVVKKAIADYIEKYPYEDIDEYLFKSRKGNGHLTEIAIGKIVKDTARVAGINRNINSHSLRKTFGRFIFHNANDKEKSLVLLCTIFNHSSVAITKKYIGLLDDEIEDVFNELNLGLDFI
jgi:integrase